MLPNKILRTNSGCLDTSTHQSRSGRPDTPRVNEREKENTKQLPQRKAPDHRRFQWIPKRKERYGWRPASNLYVSDQTEFQTLIIKQRRAVHQLWSETRMTPKGYWEKATEIKGKRGNLLIIELPVCPFGFLDVNMIHWSYKIQSFPRWLVMMVESITR